MQTQAEQVMKSLVDSYNLIKALSERIGQLETRTEQASLPWEENQVSYNKTPEPTPAVTQLATGIVKQIAHHTFNNTAKALKTIYSMHDMVCIWKNGVVTTINEKDSVNPLCVFRTRACARLALRKAGYNVPKCSEIKSENGYSVRLGGSYRQYIIAYKS